MKTYDLIVIGAGPGGYIAAVEAAKLKKSVAVIESRQAGGTCLNRGCIPTKALLHSAELMREMKENAEILGINIGEVSADYNKLTSRRDEVVQKLRSGVEQLMKLNKVDVYYAKATIDSNHKVRLSDSTELEAENILIATGSVPSVPPIEGASLPGVFTSDGLLEEKIKKLSSVVIIGGGVIGVECAEVFSSLGTKVTIIEGLDRILPLADTEISRSLTASMKKRSIDVFASASVNKIEKACDSLQVYFTQKDKELSVTADGVLIATGRRAYTEGLLSDNVTLKMQRGQIVVDENYLTSIKNIYAVGDVTFGSRQLAHAASAQAVNAVNIMFGKEAVMDMSVVPSCIYTKPEIAFVGLTQRQAMEQGIDVVCGKSTTLSNGKSVIVNAERGFVKTVFDEKSGKLIGAALMCERATDMIGGLATAVSLGLTQRELSSVIYPHPTVSESIGESIASCTDKLQK